MSGFHLGPYLVGDRVAVGGMGEVYLALRKGLGAFEKPVALKLLLPHLSSDPKAVEQFVGEANLAAQMNHPNVVQIFDVGVEGQRYYLAMELVRGVSLARLCQQLKLSGRQLTPAMMTYLSHGLCDGLHHAHTLVGRDGRPLELVHRDVSPQNVLVSVDGAVKLADFGIAKARDSGGFTRPGEMKGKLEYMAPEQFENRPSDQRTDVYAAAMTLFYAAALGSPFRRDSETATLSAVIRDPLPSLRASRPDIPAELEAALRHGAAKNRELRTASARALRDEIPVLHDVSTASELGALVRELCSTDVASLETQTRHTAQLGQTATAQQTAPLFITKSAARALTVAATLAAVGGVVMVLLSNEPRPGPVNVPASAASPTEGSERVVAPTAATPPAGETSTPEVGALPVPAPAVVPRAATPPQAARERKTAGKRVAYLTVDAQPWASVYVGGVHIGDTPLDRFPLDEGDVTLLLKNPDTGREATRRVKLIAGNRSYVKVDLR